MGVNMNAFSITNFTLPDFEVGKAILHAVLDQGMKVLNDGDVVFEALGVGAIIVE